MKLQTIGLLLLLSLGGFAQSDSLKKLNIFAYGELYYSYDFSDTADHEKPDFLYNHKRHNELNANLLLLKGSYTDKNCRANAGVMMGNYAQYNLAAEPNWAQFIYQVDCGIKISKKKNLWLDAGIMPSHIGFESAISADCWTLTRSLLAENSPYYEAGIKVGYTSVNEKLYLSALLLNGWQRIKKPDGIQRPSAGTQITWKPSEKATFNYSTFVGSDKPDSTNAFRHFHNFYVQYEPTKKFGIIAGFDFGAEKSSNNKYGLWYSPVLIVRQKINNKARVALRGEYYSDANQVIIVTHSPNGFDCMGVSVNMDWDFNEKITLRVEGRMLRAKDPLFINGSRENYAITTDITFKI